MESKQMIIIGMKISQAIIEILKDEFGEDKKGRRKNADGQKKLKKAGKDGR